MLKKNAPLVLSIALLILTACGGPTPTATATQTPATQPTPTQVPAQPSATETSGIQVMVTLADNTINSTLATFQVGVPYMFVITNSGHRAHNFNISTPLSIVGSLQAALVSALLVVDQNQLSGGATVTVQFTFPASAAGATLEFSCLLKKHYEDGMRLNITVTE